MRLRSKSKADDSLDVFACHGMGGTWGCLATGIFASTALTPGGGLINGNVHQVLVQLADLGAVWVYSFGLTWVIGKVIDKTMGLRVSETEEALGLDITQHGESAYGDQV
jgi:Amt family ammonium transporter